MAGENSVPGDQQINIDGLPGSHRLGWLAPANCSQALWEDAGRSLSAFRGRLGMEKRWFRWTIGDWWAFNERKYGERYESLAAAGIDLTYGSCANGASTARRFEFS